VDSENNPTVLPGPASADNANQYDLKEWNFPLFFGLALQEYMSTLVDGDSPFDRYHAGDTNALTAQQITGLRLFLDTGCNFCHTIPEFTTASVRLAGPSNNEGFRNIGVRPTADDPGRLEPVVTTAGTVAGSSGLFKVPTLRNVELTAPYMHNGGMGTLEQVVEFYNRGRNDFNNPGFAPGAALNLSADQKASLVAFLKALTSERVRTQKAPFDHPQLFIPNGHPVNQVMLREGRNGNAQDAFLHVPAVGRNGGPSISPNNFLP